MHRRHSLGVALDRIPRSVEAFDSVYAAAAGTAAAPAPTPPTSNFASDFLPIKDQGERGACVSFASVAALEQYHFTKTNAKTPFSEQFMYWNCKQHDGNPNAEGTCLGIAFPLLKNDGCCLATTWPYVKNKYSPKRKPSSASRKRWHGGQRLPNRWI